MRSRPAAPPSPAGRSRRRAPSCSAPRGSLDDTPEILANDIINKAHGECDHEIAWHIARESAKTVDWLVDRYRLPVSCILDFQYPGHSRMHMHASPSRFGAELLAALLAAVEAEGIPLATSARATDLYADPDGRIRGVRVTRPDGKTEDIGCDALILACCGYGGDKALIAKYIPEMVNAHYHGHAGNTGDAVKWGEELGASIKDMGSFQGHGAVATPHNTHIGWPAITEGGYQVNKHGKRFSNENEGYSEQALKVARQPDHVAWLIFDERGHKIAMQMHSHVEAEKAGALKVCNTPEEIARVIGCDAATLAQTMKEVEDVAAGRKKDPFGRDFSHQAAAQAAVPRGEGDGRAVPHAGRAGSEQGDARAEEGRHAVPQPVCRRRRRARPVRPGRLGLPVGLRPDDGDQHGTAGRRSGRRTGQRNSQLTCRSARDKAPRSGAAASSSTARSTEAIAAAGSERAALARNLATMGSTPGGRV